MAGLGSFQRRLRNCLIGIRAEPYAYGAPEFVDLELYLMWRANGMKIETPAVRPSGSLQKLGGDQPGKDQGDVGQTMIAASMRSMGTSMIIVSLSANLTGTFATAHEIIRHSP